MRKMLSKLSMAAFAAMASAGAIAGTYTQVPDPATVAQGATVNVAFQFAGDGVTQETQLDLNYNNTVFTTVVPTTNVVGSTCAVNAAPPFIRIIPPSGAGTPLTSTATTYCTFAFTAAAAAPPANYDFTVRTLECDGPTCTRSGTFRITVTGGVTNTPPNIAYNPLTGTTITYTGAGTASPIVATPSGGSGSGAAATTTVGACNITGGGAAFPTTSIAQLSFVGNTTTAQNINLPACVPQVAQVDATLTCPESLGGAAATNRVWTLRCPAAAGATAPTIAYAPPTGSTITYSGAGAASPIVATPSGGSGSGAAATTTVGACNITGGGAAFPTISIAQLSFVGNTTTAQNINLPACVPQVAQVDATLTCPESRGGAAAVNRVWTLRCPAAVVMATPPPITYSPNFGASLNVAAGASTTIQVGCPTDGSPCTGSGTGLPATSRLESLGAVYAGPMFSPLPTMQCQFVNEGGTPTGSGTLDFVAQTADPGDIRCTCPTNTTSLPNEPFTVSVSERIPASSGAVTATRTFTINCGGPTPVCGTATYTNQPAGSTITLTNGGAASTVSTVSLVGASNNVNQTITCSTSNVSAGSTFTVTTNPSPLVISTSPVLGGSISASCTNSTTTAGTATLTCTGTSATQGCASTATFTLSCPGQGEPPPQPGELVAVPTLSEQGRILLAALVLLLGLGVVGFRMRG